MSGSNQPTITFAPPRDPPDPRRTYVRNPAELDVALAQLAPGEPVVIGHTGHDAIDLGTYTRMLEQAKDAGRDVVVVVADE
jgi:hypothetical protein